MSFFPIFYQGMKSPNIGDITGSKQVVQ